MTAIGLALAAPVFAADWLHWVSGDLRRLDERAATVDAELEELGSPTLGQTVAQFGYQHPRLSAAPLAPAWVQIDLGRSMRIDAVSLIPAQVDWESAGRRAYGLPRRFRIDVSDDPEFAQFQPLAAYEQAREARDGIAPLTFPADSPSARYVRLTVTGMAEDAGQYFFAMAEMLVLSGPLNVAAGRPVSASASSTHAPRWTPQNLTDGRTPLGPPIRRELLAWDGYYIEPDERDGGASVTLDLGDVLALQQVRLHGVHARIGADIPGYSFPTRFRIEADLDPDFRQAGIVFATDDFPNPGSNPVTVPAGDVRARYVRVVAFGIDPGQQRRFGLSEVEVYADGRNVTAQAGVKAQADRHLNPAWPAALLVDGYTSYGRLMEWPEWLAGWERRERLLEEKEELAVRRSHAVASLQGILIRAGVLIAACAAAAVVAVLVAARRRRERELEQMRLRFARDLHDEIGSNLAGLAVLSEVARDESTADPSPSGRELWDEVHRIADETLGAMREVLWVSGARPDDAALFVSHLRRAADRMLAGRELVWNVDAAAWPESEDPERARHLFLFCKEAFANVVRHSQARRVEISLQAAGRSAVLTVLDDGVGFEAGAVKRGVGLSSLESRARELGAELAIVSRAGEGTRVCLVVPVDADRDRRLR